MFSGVLGRGLSVAVLFTVRFVLVPYLPLFWLCGAVCDCFTLKTSHINLLCEVTKIKGCDKGLPLPFIQALRAACVITCCH